jgi:flavin-dependent dehydrogenase
MENTYARFIIVGAGISGLQAAINLAEIGQDFIIL